MVLQQERTAIPERQVERRPFWVRWDFWSFFVAAAVILSMLILVMNSGESDRLQETMPEYEVDTLTAPEVAAQIGGPIVLESTFVGADANLDPDPPAWWVPEYEVDTLAEPEVAAGVVSPFVPVHAYVGGDANLDPDVH